MEVMKDLENKLVVQANSLIEASYKLKPSQQKFLRIMASMINKDDEDFKMYEFRISDLLELFEVKDQSKYKEIPRQTRELMGNVLTFKTNKKIIQVPFLNYCEYEIGAGILRVQFHPFLKPFYLYLSKENPYTKYELKNILPLRSVYSIRIYELLKQYEKIGNRTFSILELRDIFQIKPNEYTRYNDFKRKVLQQAQKELPLKTDISFDFQEIKMGRKVTNIKFYIHSNNKARDEIAVAADHDPHPTEGKLPQSGDDKELIKNLQRIQDIMYEHDIDIPTAKMIYDSAQGNLQVIKNVYEDKKSTNAPNFIGLMRSLVKPGAYVEPIKNYRKGKFNNYDQRQYDIKKLEKGLLGMDEEE